MTQQQVRVHVLQVAYGDEEDMSVRVERVAAMVRAQAGADLIVLPELWAHGGFAYPSWSAGAEGLDGHIARTLSAAARDVGAVLHGGSIVERASPGAGHGPEGRGLWNTSLVFGADGELAASYRKIHRFGFGEGEPRILEAGDQIVTSPLQNIQMGLATCYDLRFPELFRQLVDRGAGLFVIPAAWPKARVEQWRLLGRARAIENQAYVVQCNTAGTHSGVMMGGHSQVIAPDGTVIAEAGDDEEILVVTIDLGEVGDARETFPALADRCF